MAYRVSSAFWGLGLVAVTAVAGCAEADETATSGSAAQQASAGDESADSAEQLLPELDRAELLVTRARRLSATKPWPTLAAPNTNGRSLGCLLERGSLAPLREGETLSIRESSYAAYSPKSNFYDVRFVATTRTPRLPVVQLHVVCTVQPAHSDAALGPNLAAQVFADLNGDFGVKLQNVPKTTK